MEMGVERLLAKNGRMSMYFVSDQASPFYRSELFSRVLKFVQRQTVPCRFSEKNNKLSLVFGEVPRVEDLVRIVKRMRDDLKTDE